MGRVSPEESKQKEAPYNSSVQISFLILIPQSQVRPDPGALSCPLGHHAQTLVLTFSHRSSDLQPGFGSTFSSVPEDSSFAVSPHAMLREASRPTNSSLGALPGMPTV